MNITIDQALHELQMGRAIKIGKSAFIHPEFVDEKTYKKLKNARLVITRKRGEALFGQEFKNNIGINLKGISLANIQLLIAGKPPKKPAFAEVESRDFTAALKFAAEGELLPALINFETKEKLPKIKNQKSKIKNLVLSAEAPLNLRDSGKAKIYAFREAGKQSEHLAIVVGTPKTEPLVRVHSCCYTGDLLGSLSCDCNDQLRGALKLMHKNGGGVLVYLMQEGRGIGLINKLRAYALQAGGMDTVQANEFLGFDDEERGFGAAAEILKKLGHKKIRLISNNPRKAKELEKAGVKVTALVPMVIKHEHNKAYLATKAAKSGHLIK